MRTIPVRCLAMGIVLFCAALSMLAVASDGRRPGTRWEVTRLGDRQAPKRSRLPAATLFMGRDGTVGGSWDCNNGGSANARWSREGSFSGLGGPIIFTAMGCAEQDRTNFAASFWRFMASANRWKRSGKVLEIYAADGTHARLRLMSEIE